MFNNIRYKLAKYMEGRYGVDSLSRFLSWLLLIIVIVSIFLPNPVATPLSLVLLIVIYFRIFSRNIQKRYRENEWFLNLKSRIASFFRRDSASRAQAREFHIYKCPRCGQKIRIPRGKGRIIVRCPRCGNEFKKRS